MAKNLFVNCCIRPRSRTLVLAKYLLENLGEDFDEINVADGGFKPLDADLLEKREEKSEIEDFSDDMFNAAKQFAAAETIVIAAPLWDLSFPSYLKIYLENVLVTGLTFTYEKGVPKGLCKAKRLYYVTTAGGDISLDFGFSYVKAIAENFLGIDKVRCFSAEGLDKNGNDVEKIMREAKEKIRSYIEGAEK